ncbi:MAG: iron chelate uptake ABC transporter family permease subunit [Verrucomicrobiota bacterium]
MLRDQESGIRSQGGTWPPDASSPEPDQCSLGRKAEDSEPNIPRPQTSDLRPLQSTWLRPLLFFSLFTIHHSLFLSGAHAAKISDLTQTNWTDQALDFWSFQEPIVRTVVIGAALIGLCCGLLGSFLVVRKLSLLGDTLSHAVLPGVAMGFLWNQTKDPVAILIGATIAGVFGTVVVSWIKQTTHLKEDSAMAMVLAGFYGIGVCLTTMIQSQPTGDKSGLDKFFFGQAAALSGEDVVVIGIISAITLIIIALFYKEFLAISFDMGFSSAIGLPAKGLHYILMALLTFAIVVSLQAVGVVLVSALLITPAAAAYLLTDRLRSMLILSASFGIISGVLGAFISYLSTDIPTGPLIVIAATIIFTLAFFLGPRHGLLPKFIRRRRQRRRIGMENTLKAIFNLSEDDDFHSREFTLQALARARNTDLQEAEKEMTQLIRNEFAEAITTSHQLTADTQFRVTERGWLRSCEIVRNHRLWELYLSQAAHYAHDHVHDDAEEIEHILGEEIVQKIEDRLSNPHEDPHGRLIPTRQQTLG